MKCARDGFLPRHTCLECYHRPGNKIFGIKFKISPVMFEKKIDFSEYKAHIFPLSYLVQQKLVGQIKAAHTFKERVKLASTYYQSIVSKYGGSKTPVRIVTEILEQSNATNNFDKPVAAWARKYKLSTRTLQRYFETTTSISTKKALQIMRIRKASMHLANDPESFRYADYGYYDHSHFYKHLKQFLKKETLKKIKAPFEVVAECAHRIDPATDSALISGSLTLFFRGGGPASCGLHLTVTEAIGK